MKKSFLIAAALLLTSSQLVFSHCQLPCGIYHDQMVFQEVEEAIQTIETAVHEISHNPSSNPLERNQLVRWVMNKDNYADIIATKMNFYFLQQRIKLDAKNLSEKLISAHKIVVLCMKAKQTVDMQVVSQLRQEWEHFKTLYTSQK